MTRVLVTGRKGPKFSREVILGWRQEKLDVSNLAPVPQTDTGRQEEDSKASERSVVKELGKLSP